MVMITELLDNRERDKIFQQAQSQRFTVSDFYQDTDREALQREIDKCEKELCRLQRVLPRLKERRERNWFHYFRERDADFRATIHANKIELENPISLSSDEWLVQEFCESRIASHKRLPLEEVISNGNPVIDPDGICDRLDEIDDEIEKLRTERLKQIVLGEQVKAEKAEREISNLVHEAGHLEVELHEKFFTPKKERKIEDHPIVKSHAKVIQAKQKKASADTAFYKVPGLISEIVDLTLGSAPHPNEPLAFAGALSLMSFLVGQRVKFQEVSPNLYIAALARSGVGKDAPRKTNQAILRDIGLAAKLSEEPASGQGMEDRLFACNGEMLAQIDELDGLIRSIGERTDKSMVYLLSFLLKCYTSTLGFINCRDLSGVPQRTIHAPNLCIFGTCLPSTLLGSISPELLVNGMFSRFCFIEAGPRSKRVRPSPLEVPEDLLARILHLRDIGRPDSNLGDYVTPKRIALPSTSEGEEVLDSFSNEIDSKYATREKAGDDVGVTMYSRVFEQALKFAALYACSENPEKPTVTGDASRWATRFAMAQAENLLALVDEHLVESDFDRLCKKIVSKLGSSSRGVTRSDLLRFTKTDCRTFDGAIEALKSREQIEVAGEQSSNGKIKIVYFLKPIDE
jgi:hypothetical protein